MLFGLFAVLVLFSLGRSFYIESLNRPVILPDSVIESNRIKDSVLRDLVEYSLNYEAELEKRNIQYQKTQDSLEQVRKLNRKEYLRQSC